MVGERPPPASLLAGRWYTGSYDASWGTDRGPYGAMLIFSPAFATDPVCVGPNYSYRYGRLDNPCDRAPLVEPASQWGKLRLRRRSGPFPAFISTGPLLLPALTTIAGGEVVELP